MNSVVYKILSLDIRAIPISIILLPYFEPWSLDKVVDSGVYGLSINLLSWYFQIGKIVISLISLLIAIKYREFLNKYTTIIIVYSVVRGIAASITSGEISAELYQIGLYIGFIALLFNINRIGNRLLLSSILICFFIQGIAALISIYGTDGGLLPGIIDPGARIYSFGGKNGIFIALLPLVIFKAYSNKMDNEKSLIPSIVSFVFATTSYFIRSSSSMLCFLLVGFALLPSIERVFSKHISYKIVGLVLLFVFAGIVLTPLIIPFIGELLGLLGRDITFSGRDGIWKQAIAYFLSSPIIGYGNTVVYDVWGISGFSTTNIAHCYYLDIIAKYGIITGVCLLLTIVYVLYELDNKTNKFVSYSLGIGFIILLLHSIFDDLNFYIFLLLTFSIFNETLLETNKKE